MLKAIKKRRSVREYLPKEVEKEKLDEILKAAMFSPTAHNRRSWEFAVVREIIGAPEKIRILCLMPLGYPAEKKGEHEDSEFDVKKIHHDKW